ncbi:hypothetical protein [Acuticoccus sediminis]|uniref:hypothetical protein n=1 Tax=Acuticoccus sediminis TaxID=2184697 RepID=UPI00192E3E48|nr:hypothetical protein [Acuticoccus sediminis]
MNSNDIAANLSKLDPSRPYVDRKTASDILGMPYPTLSARMRLGIGPHVIKVGSGVLYDLREVEAYAEALATIAEAKQQVAETQARLAEARERHAEAQARLAEAREHHEALHTQYQHS